MDKPKIITVFGTRPEAVKMAPLINELKKRGEIETTVCVSAQHRQMLDQALGIFNIAPDIDLDIMRESQTLTDITSRVINSLKDVFAKVKPALCLVHGDTTTAFAAALAAFYAGVKVGHVEAGLRTYDKYQPYPEEMNRLLTSRLADLHFAPTLPAKQNLLKENIPSDTVYVTGNTVIDALFYTAKDNYTFKREELNRIDYSGHRVITLTAHRRENIGGGLINICRAALGILERYPDTLFVYPVHLNPAVQEPVRRLLSGHTRAVLTEPLDITDMHNLIKRSYLVMTDSGGLQEEAPSLDKPVIVLRNVTERPEGLAAGTLVLTGSKENEIVKHTSALLDDKALYGKMASAKNPFGDGRAAERITNAVLYYLGLSDTPPGEFA